VIAQIVQDHLKVGKDIIYKRALASAVAQGLAKSFKPKTEKEPVEEAPVETESTEDAATKPDDSEPNPQDTEEVGSEQEEKPDKPAASAVNREVPSEVSAQPNTQESIEQSSVIDESLIALHSALQELEMLARDQQMMSEDEMQVIIIPLQEKVSLLLNALKGGILGESEEVSQEPTEDTPEETEEIEEPTEETQSEEKPVHDSEEEQRTRKKPQGPARKPGTDTVARELTEPSTNFVGKITSNSDLHKGFFGIGGQGRGWKGDPAGHAEAARERWAAEGVPVGGKPKPAGAPRATATQFPAKAPQRTLSENALVLPKAVKDMALQTAGRAGRTLARNAGDAIAELAWTGFGTVAGLVLYRFLAGKSISPAKLGTIGVASLRGAVASTLKMARVSAAVKALKMERTLATFAAGGKKVVEGMEAAKAPQRIAAALAAQGKRAEFAKNPKAYMTALNAGSKISAKATQRAAVKAAALDAAKKLKKPKI